MIVSAAEAGADTWPLTLSQTLTVGPNTRIGREAAAVAPEAGFVPVELPREQFVALRDKLGLAPGARVHLQPKRVAATLMRYQ